MSDSASPEEANALFEVLAAGPPTATEQAVVRDQLRAVRWLGDYNVPCSLGRAFEVDGKPLSRGPLQPGSSETLVGAHLSGFSQTLAIMRDGARSCAALGQLTREFVDRSIVKQGSVRERVPGDGFHIGQFVVYATEDDIRVVEAGERNLHLNGLPFLRLDRPDDEKLFVRTDSLQRYHVKRVAGGVAVTSELVRTLEEDDPAYFDQLHADIQAYLKDLSDALSSVGVDPATITDRRTGKLRHAFLREEVDPIIKGAYMDGRISQDLIRQMGARLWPIWENIRNQRSYNPVSGATKHTGIRATGFRVQSYYDALLRQIPHSDS